MNYVFQLMIIFGVSMVGELLYVVLPFPVPASVYGLIILFVLLSVKIVKVEQVEGAAKYLMAIMPLFFIEPSVGLMNSFEAVQGKVMILFLASFLAFLSVMVVTGHVAQFFIKRKNKKVVD